MDLPDSDWDSTPMAEALLDEDINPGFNPILVEAVQNPEYRSMVLKMEEFIQRFVRTDFQNVEFPSVSNPYLRAILSLLALHYGIRSVSIEGTILTGTRIPHSRIPSNTLSSIPPPQLKDDTSDNSKFIEASINLERQTGGASSSNINFNQTYPWPNTVMEQTSFLDASNLQDQPVAYPTSIPQFQLMQHGASVSKPALPPHGAGTYPYVAGDFLCNPSVGYYTQLMQGPVPLSQETLQYQPTGTYSGLLHDVVTGASQLMQGPVPLSKETLQYQPIGTYSGLLQDVVTGASQPASYSHMQLPVLQSTQQFSLDDVLPPQPRPEAAQPPHTSVAFQNQDAIYVRSSSEDDETGRAQKRGSTAKRGRPRKNTRPN